MDYKAIIFDMDGVIINTEILHFKAYKEVLITYGYKLTQEIYNRHFRSKGRKAGITALFESVTPNLIREIGAKKDDLYLAYINAGNFEFFSDTKVLIDHCLLNKIPLAIGTASSMGRVVVAKSGLSYFDVIVTAADVEKSKPAPDIYLKCALDLGLDPSDLVVIEDSESGVEAALAAGMSVVFVKRDDAPDLSEKLACLDSVTLVSDLRKLVNM